MNIGATPQPVAFLNGTKGLNGPEEVLYYQFLKRSIEPILVEELYRHPENLMVLKEQGVKSLVIQTTGQNRQDMEKAIDYFRTMEYVPENIILIFPDALYSTVGDFTKAHPEVKAYEWMMGKWFDELEF